MAHERHEVAGDGASLRRRPWPGPRTRGLRRRPPAHEDVHEPEPHGTKPGGPVRGALRAATARSDRIGSLEIGKQADLMICDIPDYRHLCYHFGINHVWRVVKRGRVVYAA